MQYQQLAYVAAIGENDIAMALRANPYGSGASIGIGAAKANISTYVAWPYASGINVGSA